MSKIIPYITIILAMLIWAGSGIAVKEALVVFSPLTLIVLRFTIAVLLMAAVGMIFHRNEVLQLQRVDTKHILLFALGGLCQPFLYFIFETYTYQSFDSPTIAEAMLSTQPIMAPIFAFVLLREQVTANHIWGILISTLGMLILLLVGTNDYSIGNPWGILLAVLTVCMSVSYTVVLRRIPARYSSLTIVFYVQAFSLILFYLVWAVKGECVDFLQNVPVLLNDTPNLLNSGLAVLYLAVFSSVTAFILFCYTVREIGVTRANIFNNVRPVFTALLMWILFDEHLPLWKWVGIIVIIFGLFISQKQRKK